nr:hypothetical protein [Tanacetum cinerariifolium]
MRAEIKVLRSERLAYEQEGIQTREALARSEAYCRALEARVAVLETHARVDGPPKMPEDPYAYVVAGFQALPPPDYVLGPEEPEQASPSPVYIPYVPEPVYPEYIPPEDDVFPAEEQRLPAAASPGYIPESDPDEDPKDDDEHSEEDPADYPADHNDEEEEEPSGDDADEENEEQDEDDDD